MFHKGDRIKNVNDIPGIVSRTYYLGEELVVCGYFDRSPADEFRLPASHIILVESAPQQSFNF